jgi:hypothetical protein
MRALVGVAGVWAMAHTATAAQGGGQVSVSDSGQPTFSYPLTLPPGIGGMVPQLGLLYAGGDGAVNGPVGVGWSVQGISTVTRCPAIVGADGPRAGSSNLGSYAVKFAPSDKLCLDGQRLIQTSATGVVVTPFPQTNDALGTSGCVEFRTEKDTYARILACGTAGSSTSNGPAYFKVWTKSGLIYEYGVDPAVATEAVSNAQIPAQGSTVITAWAVSRVSDTVGNYMDFMYEQRTTGWGSGPSGGAPAQEWNLLEIQYTGNSANGQKPTAKVVFTYTDRPVYASTSIQDRAEAYHSGSKNVSIRLLQAITTYVNWTGGTAPASPQAIPSGSPAAAATAGAVAVKTWTLTYNQGPVSNRSRLASIAECAGGPTTSGAMPTTCMPPTQFSYTAGGSEAYKDSPNFNLATLPIQSTTGNSGVFIGDFRGVGRQDLVVWSDTPSSNALYFSNGDGSFTKATNGTGAGQFNITTQNLFKSDGCFYSLAADFNGDGRVDILRVAKPTNVVGVACNASNILYLSNGDGSFNPITLPSSISLAQTTMTYSIKCSGWEDVTHKVCSWNTDTWSAGANFYVADINGDGLLDIITTSVPNGSVRYDISMGPPSTANPCLPSVCTHVYLGSISGGTFSFSEVPSNLAHVSVYAPPTGFFNWIPTPLYVSDANGDGLSDLTGMTDVIGVYSVFFLSSSSWLSRGDGNFDPGGSGCQFPIDFNGDQRVDCLYAQANPDGSANPGYNFLSVSTGNSVIGAADFNLNATGDEMFKVNTATSAQSIGITVADFNGDGRGDILRWEEDATKNALFLSNGDGTFRQSSTFNLRTINDVLATSSGSNGFVTGDFTGQGNTEILRTVANPTGTTPSASNNRLYVKTDPTPPDQLLTVTSPTGSVTTLGYALLTNSGGRYASDRGTSNAPTAPVMEINSPVHVVTDLYEDTAVGASGAMTRRTQYAYTSLRAKNDGRGSLGFRNIQRQMVAPNGEALTTSTDYLQSWPYTGVAWRSRTFRGALGSTAVPISETDYVYCEQSATPLSATALASIAASSCPSVSYTPASAACAPGNPYVYRPYLNQSTECGWDLGGTPSSPVKGPMLPAVTTTYGPWTAGASPYTVDGDPEVITVTTSGTAAFGVGQTFTKTTTNQYQADNTSPGYWLIGRLASSTVQNTVPNMNLGTGSSQLAMSAGTGSTAQSGTATPLSSTVSPASLSVTQAGSASFSAGATLTVGGSPTPPLSFSWSRLSQSGPPISQAGPATSSSLSTSFTFTATLSSAAPSSTATWQVTAVDAAGRSAAAQIPIGFNYQAPPPIAVTSSPNPVTGSRNNPGTGTASTTLNISGGVAPYTVTWTHTSGTRIAESGTTTATFSVTLGWAENLTENYTATVTDSAGQQQSVGVPVTFTTPAQPAVTVAPNPVVTANTTSGAATSSATATATGGTGGFTYAWVRTVGSRITVLGGQTATFSVTLGWSENLTETFQVTATDSGGNTATASVNVTFTTPAQPTVSLSVSPSPVVTARTAAGAATSSATATANGGTGSFSYSWVRTVGSRIAVSGGQTATFSVTLGWSENLTETFQVTATDTGGNKATASVNVTFTTPAQPAVAISPNPLATARTSAGAATSSATATATGGTGSFSYSWVRTVGSRIAVSGGQTATFSVTLGWSENLTETFQVTATDTGGNTATTSVNVTFTTPGQPTVAISPTPVVTAKSGPGAATSSATAAASGGTGSFSYSWVRTGGSRITVSGGQTATFSVTLGWSENLSETFQVTATDSAGNPATASVVVTFTTPPAPTLFAYVSLATSTTATSVTDTWTFQNTNAGAQTITGISESGSPGSNTLTYSGGSCVAGQALAAGATCTVIYTADKACPAAYTYAGTISNAAGTTTGAFATVPYAGKVPCGG